VARSLRPPERAPPLGRTLRGVRRWRRLWAMVVLWAFRGDRRARPVQVVTARSKRSNTVECSAGGAAPVEPAASGGAPVETAAQRPAPRGWSAGRGAPDREPVAAVHGGGEPVATEGGRSRCRAVRRCPRARPRDDCIPRPALGMVEPSSGEASVQTVAQRSASCGCGVGTVSPVETDERRPGPRGRGVDSAFLVEMVARRPGPRGCSVGSGREQQAGHGAPARGPVASVHGCLCASGCWPRASRPTGARGCFLCRGTRCRS